MRFWEVGGRAVSFAHKFAKKPYKTQKNEFRGGDAVGSVWVIGKIKD